MEYLLKLPDGKQVPQSVKDWVATEGGSIEAMPNMNELGIPNGKVLTDSQLNAVIEQSLQSKSQSLQEFSKQIRHNRHGG